MANEIVASNDFLQGQARLLRALFDSGYSLRLYTNPLSPTPKNSLADFVEASFTGYARKNMAGQWGPLQKTIDGEWGFVSKPQTFLCLFGGAEVINGWYLVGDGKLALSGRFPVAIKLQVGGSVPVTVNCQTWATSLLCTTC